MSIGRLYGQTYGVWSLRYLTPKKVALFSFPVTTVLAYNFKRCRKDERRLKAVSNIRHHGRNFRTVCKPISFGHDSGVFYSWTAGG